MKFDLNYLVIYINRQNGVIKNNSEKGRTFCIVLTLKIAVISFFVLLNYFVLYFYPLKKNTFIGPVVDIG